MRCCKILAATSAACLLLVSPAYSQEDVRAKARAALALAQVQREREAAKAKGDEHPHCDPDFAKCRKLSNATGKPLLIWIDRDGCAGKSAELSEYIHCRQDSWAGSKEKRVIYCGPGDNTWSIPMAAATPARIRDLIRWASTPAQPVSAVSAPINWQVFAPVMRGGGC